MKEPQSIKAKVLLGAAMLFAFIVVALLIYGVLTWDEPGWISETARWEEAPLTVSCHGYVTDDDSACRTAEDVVAVINTRLGFDMLRWGVVSGDPDITVTMRAPVDVSGEPAEAYGASPAGSTGTDPGGVYVLTGHGDTYAHCDVQTMNVSGGAGNLEWLTVYHEIGHCIGLGHDDYKQSIMFPVQEATPDRQIPSWISDWDRDLIRERYMP